MVHQNKYLVQLRLMADDEYAETASSVAFGDPPQRRIADVHERSACSQVAEDVLGHPADSDHGACQKVIRGAVDTYLAGLYALGQETSHLPHTFGEQPPGIRRTGRRLPHPCQLN